MVSRLVLHVDWLQQPKSNGDKTMREKIKKWFGILDLNKDGKVTTADLEIARAIADKNAKIANETLNAVSEAAEKIKKVRKKKWA